MAGEVAGGAVFTPMLVDLGCKASLKSVSSDGSLKRLALHRL